MSKSKQKAFTLIELLVVIAIIGILATLAIVSLQQARQNARDSKRVADMKQVQTALELYFNENGFYPSPEEFNSGSIVSSAGPDQSIFMHNIPSAPTPADGNCLSDDNVYFYTQTDSGASYTIDFCTGKKVSDLPPGSKQMTPGGIIIGGENSGNQEMVDVSFSLRMSGHDYNMQSFKIKVNNSDVFEGESSYGVSVADDISVPRGSNVTI